MTTTSNQIAEENQRPGTPESEWGLANGPSDNIEGFSTNISVNVGEQVDFKVNTDSTHYHLEIYRLGYYDGDGARLVATIDHQSTSPDIQPDPMVDLTTGLVDAGNWHVTDFFQLPADAISGVYIAKLVREDGVAGENHIPFIVRDDSSHSDVVFQTADELWQAYNTWGGSSLYTSDIVSPAATAVSYNRPLDTYLLNASIFGQEYAAIRWLEENGYDVTYQAGVDTARDGDLLLNHKIFMDAGHDEYWSGAQRDNVEAARDAGLNLAFLTGNEIYWRTRFEPGVDGAADRTLITYKEPYGGTDPSSEWTGMWRSLDFPGGAQPENALTGTLFMAQNSVDPISVPYHYSNFRFWANTSIADLNPGETAQLPGLLGYEWDVDAENGFRPAGLVNLSSTTINVAEGPSTGQQTHSLNLYRAESGALVFGAGTVFWSWGLDSHHSDYSDGYTLSSANWYLATEPNSDVQQAMVNLLADMGVQPATIQSHLVPGVKSTDSEAPVSTINTPTEIPAVGRPFLLTGESADLGGGLVAGNEVSTDGGLTWFKAYAGWSYTWVPEHIGLTTIQARAVDDSLNLGAVASMDLWVANTVDVAENTLDVTVVADTSIQLDMLNLAHGVCAFCGGTDPALAGGVSGIDILSLALAGPDAALLTIDQSTGALSFIASPDFELPSDANGDNRYEVTVERSAGSFHDSIPLVVNVTNVGPETETGTSLNDNFFAVGDKSTFNGLSGNDTVSYALASRAITASLTAVKSGKTSANADTYKSIENLTGSAFNDSLTGDTGPNVLEGGPGADRLDGGSGVDTASYAHATAAVTAALGNSKSNTGDAAGDTYISIENLIGSNFNDQLAGNGGANVLVALGGNDWLDGGTGADRMIGGLGDDTYVVENSKDVADETDGDGIDTVRSSITFSLSDTAHAVGTIEYLTLTGKSSINATGNGLDNIIFGNTGNNILDGRGGADWLLGDLGTDAVTYTSSPSGVNVSLATGLGSGGDAEGDQLFNIENLTGSKFDDTLEGDGGNNVLSGGLQFLTGDTVSYANAEAGSNGVGVTVNLNITKAQNTVTAGNDTLSGFENLTGSEFNDTLVGNNGNNILTGLGGNDWLDAGAGADRMIGGTGDDTYVVDNAGDVVDETEGNGYDVVRSSISFSLADALHVLGAIEYLTLTGKSSINGTGNELDNIIFGNTGNNVLEGRGGADWLLGDLGIDTAIYTLSQTGVDVSLATGVGSGGDAEGDQLFNIENLTGSNFDDTLEGDGGNNVLTGGLQFLMGDTVSYAHAASGANGVGVTVSLAITTAQNTVTAGKDTLVGFENLTGSESNDTLLGNVGNNILTGLGGNDWLDGGAGADRMIGGIGNDTYVVDNVGDVVDETDGNGLDTVRSSVSFSLADPAHAAGAIENLTLTGASWIDGTGNELANILIGNAGNNILEGRAGGDWLLGDLGTDTAAYAFSPAAVNVSLATGLGSGGDAEGDQLFNIENLTGSSFDDTLEGDGGNNVLTGGLNGTAGDTVSYAHATSGANGIGVTVSLATTSAQNTVTAGTDTLVGFENLTGSEFNDTLTGNSGNNVLTGLGGNDALIGGLGADTLIGGAGKDQFVYRSAAEGGDHIQDFTVTEDSLVFSASGFGGGLVAHQQLVAGVSFVADAVPTATTNAGSFLFNTETHDLLWDFDGLGAGDAVQIAHFDTAINLTINHFEITA